MKLTRLSTEELEAELARRKELEEGVPSPLKLADFSKLQQQVIAAVQGLVKNGRPPKDFEHYIYEAAMEAVYGKDFWAWWNKHADY